MTQAGKGTPANAHRVDVSKPASTPRFWFFWLLTFLGFPLGGYLTSLTIGPLDTPVKALLGGALTGVVIGLAQWLVLRGLLGVRPTWIAATSLGLALGLGLSVALIGNQTDTLSLLTRGLLTGFTVAVAQAFLLRGGVRRRYWVVGIALLWPLAWVVTRAVIGVATENDYAVFGASGALAFTLFSGFLLKLRKVER